MTVRNKKKFLRDCQTEYWETKVTPIHPKHWFKGIINSRLQFSYLLGKEIKLNDLKNPYPLFNFLDLYETFVFLNVFTFKVIDI